MIILFLIFSWGIAIAAGVYKEMLLRKTRKKYSKMSNHELMKYYQETMDEHIDSHLYSNDRKSGILIGEILKRDITIK